MDVSFRGDANANNIQIMRRTTNESTLQSFWRSLVSSCTFPIRLGLLRPLMKSWKSEDGSFAITDVLIDAYDEEGVRSGFLILLMEVVEGEEPVVTLSHRDPNNPGREFLIQIDESRLVAAYTALRGGGASLEIHTLLIISIPPEQVQDATLRKSLNRKGRTRTSLECGE